MLNILFKYYILFISKSSIMVGGQAVIEGVMMRVPGSCATAVRTSSGKIEILYQKITPLVEKYNVSKIPCLRGFLHLVDSMKLGFKSLEWSASFVDDNNSSPPNKYIDFVMTLLSIIFAFCLFMLIPYSITTWGLENQTLINKNNVIFNLIAGFTRISIFVLYLYLLSHMKDIKRLFQYHGAEHKVVYNFESGKELNIKNAKSFSTLHPRCGTSFVFILMLVTILTYSILDSLVNSFMIANYNLVLRIIIHLLFLPVVAGLGYEVLKFLAKNQDNFIFYSLSLPGLWLQQITTKEPSHKQLEVSIVALSAAFNNNLIKFRGKKFEANAIG